MRHGKSSGRPYPVHHVVQSYTSDALRRFFYLARTENRTIEDERWCTRYERSRAVFAFYLRAYISGAIVSRSSLGAEREIEVVTLTLQLAVFVPSRCGWQSTFPNCTPAEKYTYSFLARGRAYHRVTPRPHIRFPGEKSNGGYQVEFKALDIKVSANPKRSRAPFSSESTVFASPLYEFAVVSGEIVSRGT